jgi:hypothetical protein
MPRRRRRPRSRSRISAWIVTSSAGRRLVGDEQVGLARDRHRDHDALAHAARELMRVVVRPGRRLRDADLASSSTARVHAARAEIGLWMRSTSATWKPAVSTGFSAVIGSWKIIAMRAPRSFRIACSGSERTSMPSKTIRPPVIRPASGRAA